MPSLASALAKLRRADVHLAEAYKIWGAFIKRDLYTISKQEHPDRWHTISIAAINDPPPMLALAIGDVANCLRSALDHIAFACTARTPTDKEERAIEFPITSTNEAFKSSVGRFKDCLIPAALDLIDSFQPGPSPQYAGCELLTIIREVNNRDKHRGLSIMSTAGTRAYFIPLIAPPGAVIAQKAMIVGPLKVGTELARFQLREGVSRNEVEMNGKVVVTPIFGDGMPKEVVGKLAIDSLIDGRNFILEKIVPAFVML